MSSKECPDLSRLRNIGIIAHIDAGKTTLSERILFYTKKIHRIGEVHDGAATMDFMPEEQERGITITSACTTCVWHDTKINLIDTPGHVDFTIEVERALRVLDGAVGVFCAVGGVEPQSETVWKQSGKIPKLAFINKMDRIGANFSKAIKDIREKLKANAVPLIIPLGEGEDFRGVIDIIKMKKILFNQDDQGQTYNYIELDDNEKDYALPWRDNLLEKLADIDEEFFAKWLENSMTEKDIEDSIKNAANRLLFVPAFCGSALKNTGVQPLLDAITDYLPSPLDAKKIFALLPDGKQKEVKPQAGENPLLLVFKVVVENGRKTCFIRMYAGSIKEGDILGNARTGKQERIGRLFKIHADRREDLPILCAGDIAAVTGLRDAKTGDTWEKPGGREMLEPINAYDPVITLALEPRNADEGKILDEALDKYLVEDPTLKLELDEESGLRMLSGMGELHLEVLLERMEREYKIKPRSGQPQVVLRETVNANAKASAIFDRELGKEKHHGEVAVSIMPLPGNTENEIIFGEFLPKDAKEARRLYPPQYLEEAESGVKNALLNGSSGWPMLGVKVEITGIKKEDGLTTLPGIRMAAGDAVREAVEKAKPKMLEPIMEVEIKCPEDFIGAAINLFNQCGGKIDNLELNGDMQQLKGTAPLRKLFGFSTKLRSATQGRAGFILSFLKFDVP